MKSFYCLAATSLALSATALHAQAPVALESVQTTFTRDAESVARTPASVTIISGEELRARGANDLRSALALVAGVEGTPGGDNGPAGSVPALWGLREADSYLLVIDGVPVGGAFMPQTQTVDLTGIARIEVLRGAAPVMYGATSFNGVIHLRHYEADETPSLLELGLGTQDSHAVGLSQNLGALGGLQQSVTLRQEQRGYTDDRTDWRRSHLLYRLGGETSLGRVRLDLDFTHLAQTPSSGLIRNGGSVRTDVPEEANHNPADAKMDEDRGQLNLSLERSTTLGAWSTLLSVAQTKDEIIRGYLRNTPDTNGKPATGYTQEREITDIYFDTHLSQALTPALHLTYGLDYLYGKGEQEAERYGYAVNVDGSGAASSTDPANTPDPVEPGGETEAMRNFLGAYVQAGWQLSPTLDVLAGLRINATQDEQEGEDDSTTPPTAVKVKQDHTRLSGVLGGSWEVARSGADYTRLYASYRNTFKPIAVEFGPEAEVNSLQPETAQSYELGTRGLLASGQVDYDLSVFQFDFKNMKTLDTAGKPANAGQTRFRGAEVEARWHADGDLQLAAHYAYHDPRFVHFNRNGTPGGVVDGNVFEMAPYHLAGLGVLYLPAQGLHATLTGNYAGARWLNKGNTVQAGGYDTWDASLGYQFARYAVNLHGYNLTDARDPVAESEFSEEIAGTPTFYRLPGRLLMLSVSMTL